MKQIIYGIGITILTSLFFFPFETPWLPGVNTKMALAAIGLILLFVNGARKGQNIFNFDLVSVSLWALAVSIIGVISVTINETEDYTYATYFVSMWVWIGGAYTVVKAIDGVHGRASLIIVSNYLILVCDLQCILSQLIQYYPSVKSFVDSLMISGGYMGINESRLYGLGCALDVAGLRFAAVLIVIAYLSVRVRDSQNDQRLLLFFYLASFAIILTFGSIIARTTNLGGGIAIFYWIAYSIYVLLFDKKVGQRQVRYFWEYGFVLFLIILPIMIYQYNSNIDFKEDLRFGFEGFFSLFEDGEWKVRSNDQLMSQWYWPDNTKTWIIGDGYFNSPNTNPYYLGPLFEGYYMGTDVGYCRFVFYFGIIGLLAFSLFFIDVARVCAKNQPRYALMFWLVLIMNFIGWCKVSTDIFPIFALFLMLGKADSVEENVLTQEEKKMLPATLI